MIILDQIDNGKDSVLPPLKFVDLIETLGDGFHSQDLFGNLRKVYPNKSGNLYRFVFVRWYVDQESLLRRGGITFGGLGLKGEPAGSSERNIFEISYTEEVTGAGKAIFEVRFKFVASEARKKFDSTAS